MYFIFILAAITTLLGIIFLTVSIFLYRNWKKHPEKKKNYLVFLALGIGCILPLLTVILPLSVTMLKTKADNDYSLSYQVMNGNYKDAERLLKKGVSPDCTLDSNVPAKSGEQTLLSKLCKNGFSSSSGHSHQDGVSEEELAMMQLLIDYGADLESVTYQHEEDYIYHQRAKESGDYNDGDQCGYTPLLYAVYKGDLETVKLLVENGANINVTDFCGNNAVEIVVNHHTDETGVELLTYLLEEGCDGYVIKEYGQTNDIFSFGYDTYNDEMLEILKEKMK